MVDSGWEQIANRKVKRFKVDDTGTVDIVDAVPGSRIRLNSCIISASGATVLTFYSDDTILGVVRIKANDPPVVMGRNPDGWFETLSGETFRVTNSLGVTLNMVGTYVEL